MRKLIHIPIVALLILFASNDLSAQFTLTGELRPRTEFRNGFKRLREKSTDPAFFIEQRSRLYFDFKREKIRVNISLQDVRIWGAADQIYKEDPSLTNVYEAFAAYSFNEKYGFKIGRQAMDYNNARFLGNLDWAQQGRSHDALLFTGKNADRKSELHLAFAYNQSMDPIEPRNLGGTEYIGVSNYKTMIFGWWNKKFENGGISALFHNDGRQVQTDTSMAHRQTYAILGNYNLGGVKLDGEFYYQGGKNGNAVEVSGLMFTLHGTYDTDITPLTLGFEYLSGTARGEDKDKSFNPLYGTNHKFYGFMDYFYVGNYHGQAGGGKTSGLIDLHLKTKFKIGNKSNLAANLHYFMSPVKIYRGFGTANGTYGSSLGTEVDLVYTAVLAKDVKFNLGYSQMFATEAMEAVKDGGDRSALNNWAWAMIAFKPQLFSTAKD
ncbi:MAG: alginate export family protein [Cytophagales bacterium]|nr:alginate export family protein [Cytophagales bacterium]